MASKRGYHCEYCGRHDFKTQYGLTQHQATGPCREALLQESTANSDATSPRCLRSNRLNDGPPPLNVPSPPQKNTVAFRHATGVEDAHIDDIIVGFAGLLDEEDGVEADTDEEEDDDDGYGDPASIFRADASVSSASSLPELGSGASSSSEELEEDGDWPTSYVFFGDASDEDGDESDEEGGAPAKEAPCTWIRDQFREYCNSFTQKYNPDLEKDEKASISLIDLLRRKKAPMNAHREVMAWHLKYKGVMEEVNSLRYCDQYLSRDYWVHLLLETVRPLIPNFFASHASGNVPRETTVKRLIWVVACCSEGTLFLVGYLVQVVICKKAPCDVIRHLHFINVTLSCASAT